MDFASQFQGAPVLASRGSRTDARVPKYPIVRAPVPRLADRERCLESATGKSLTFACGAFCQLLLNGVLGSSLGGGHCTFGWAPTPTTWAASGRRRTLKAIHAPLIASTTAPAGT